MKMVVKGRREARRAVAKKEVSAVKNRKVERNQREEWDKERRARRTPLEGNVVRSKLFNLNQFFNEYKTVSGRCFLFEFLQSEEVLIWSILHPFEREPAKHRKLNLQAKRKIIFVMDKFI